MWLSGLHYPKSYLAAVMQIACRKNNWQLENASIQTEVTCHVNAEEIEERPDYVNPFTCLQNFQHFKNTQT